VEEKLEVKLKALSPMNIKTKSKRSILPPNIEYFVQLFEDDTFQNFLKKMLLWMKEWMLLLSIIKLKNIGKGLKEAKECKQHEQKITFNC
jgi:hypothetical protein